MKRLTLFASFFLLWVSMSRADELRPFTLSEEPLASGNNPKSSEADSPDRKEETSSTSRRVQWWMFTAAWCAPCQAARQDFEPWLQRSGWIIKDSPQAHIRLIDADRQADVVQQLGIRSFPTFVLMQNGRERFRHEGYPGRAALVEQFDHAYRTSEPAVGAISVGTLPGQQENVVQLLAVMKPLLGSEGKLTLRLDRPGTPVAILPVGDRLSVRSDNPLVMTYTLKNDVLMCRFSQPYPRARFTWGLPVEQSISAVSVSVSEMVIELPHAPDIRLTIEPKAHGNCLKSPRVAGDDRDCDLRAKCPRGDSTGAK